jgi:hypothetical protein
MNEKNIESFIKSADILFSLRLLKNGLNCGIKIQIKEGSETKIDVQWPDEDDFRSFLLSFRLFISEKEPVFLGRIYNICIQNAHGDDLAKLKRSREYFLKIQGESSFKFIFNGKEVKPHKVASLFISGQYFHVDQDKSALLEQLGMLDKMILRDQFMGYIISVVKHIMFLYQICKNHLANKILII